MTGYTDIIDGLSITDKCEVDDIRELFFCLCIETLAEIHFFLECEEALSTV
jgi:hypothetical protein